MSEQTLKILIVLAIILLAFVMQSLRLKSHDYQCGKCGERFSPELWKAFFTIHSFGGKLLKCPKCGKWTFAYPVKKDSGL